MNFTMDASFNTPPARMKVLGIGGAGGNAVDRMIQAGLQGVEFISLNTDIMALDANHADTKVQIGTRLTKGLGAGANPEIGFQACQENRDEIADKIKGADMIFITAGMGGGTGSGAAPVIAQIAREMGILSVAIVTRPFAFEGPKRAANARRGFDELAQFVDTIISIPNQKLLTVADRKTTIKDAFRLADEVLYNATRGISELILRHGDVNVDFADVKAVMSCGGEALMGAGRASGEGRALKAAEAALHSPLLDDIDIAGATGMLVNFTGSDLGLMEVEEAMSYFREALGEDAQDNTIWGIVDDPEYGDELSVTLIATGFSKAKAAEPVRVEVPGARPAVVRAAQPVSAMPAAAMARPEKRDGAVFVNLGAGRADDAGVLPRPVDRASDTSRIDTEKVRRDPTNGASRRTGHNLPDILDDVDLETPTFLRNFNGFGR